MVEPAAKVATAATSSGLELYLPPPLMTCKNFWRHVEENFNEVLAFCLHLIGLVDDDVFCS
jgi:hypothetical protein